MGLRRPERTGRRGLQTLGPEVLAGIRVVVSDLGRPSRAVGRNHRSPAVQILDRFHRTALLNTAGNPGRRGEGQALRAGAGAGG